MNRPAPMLVAAALALACTKARTPGAPIPLAVNPSRAAAVSPVRIEISGRDFDAKVKADFAGDGRGGLDVGFTARLEPAGGGAGVPLAGVVFTPRRTLLATVPAGIARDTYHLVVRDPEGRIGVLERAYRVIASAESVARFEVALGASPRAGAAFGITVTALDAGGAVVDGFDGTVTLSDTAGEVRPRPQGPFVLGASRGRLTIHRLVASDALLVTDGAGHTGTSASFGVTAGPPVALAFESAPVSARAGACSPRLELGLRDAQGLAAVAQEPVEVQLQSAPPGLAFFGDEGCSAAISSITFPPGEGRARLHFRPAAAGAVTVRALPASLPSAVQAEAVSP